MQRAGRQDRSDLRRTWVSCERRSRRRYNVPCGFVAGEGALPTQYDEVRGMAQECLDVAQLIMSDVYPPHPRVRSVG